MIGMIEFVRHKCDYVVFECGIGAKLDATNVIDYPESVCSTITSVGYDHQEILGQTLEEIASEKAFIIKKNVPCVLGPSCIPLQSV